MLYTNHGENKPESSFDWERPEEVTIDGLTDRVYNRERAEIWLGAARGMVDWFHGFLGTFKISASSTLDPWGRSLEL